MTTSDNIHLSEVSPSGRASEGVAAPFAVSCKLPSESCPTDTQVQQFLNASNSQATCILWPLWKIRGQTGHTSDATLERYIRREGIKRELFTPI
jgi:hypothetical protein